LRSKEFEVVWDDLGHGSCNHDQFPELSLVEGDERTAVARVTALAVRVALAWTHLEYIGGGELVGRCLIVWLFADV